MRDSGNSRFNVYFIKKCFPAFILLCAVCLAACSLPAHTPTSNCIEHRAAFDIGSSTLKMQTARVDTCSNQSPEPVLQENVRIPFSENMHRQLLSEDIRHQAMEQLKRMKTRAESHGAQKFAGVATAVFRQSANTPQFLAEIQGKTGIGVRLISQDEEAILGYRAAAAGMPSGNFVVWDIGGNSMQMTVEDRPAHYVVYRGDTASVSFKNLILKKILGRSPGEQSSPNPIGLKNLEAALALAAGAAREVPVEMKNRLRQPDVKIVGIGGVHNQSVKQQTGITGRYTREDLLKAIKTRIEWSDAQIGGPYAGTDVSNLILVLGFMSELNIEAVALKNVNLTDGVLYDASFWQ